MEFFFLLGLGVLTGTFILFGVGCGVYDLLENFKDKKTQRKEAKMGERDTFYTMARASKLIAASDNRMVDISEEVWDYISPLPYHSPRDAALKTLQIAEAVGLIEIKQQKEGTK